MDEEEPYDKGFREGWEQVILILLEGIESGQIKSVKTFESTLKTIQRINKIIEERDNEGEENGDAL